MNSLVISPSLTLTTGPLVFRTTARIPSVSAALTTAVHKARSMPAPRVLNLPVIPLDAAGEGEHTDRKAIRHAVEACLPRGTPDTLLPDDRRSDPKALRLA